MPSQQPDRPDLTPAQERAVRDLLARARHDEPVPDDVAARLDETLAGLVAERGADTVAEHGADTSAERGATVTPLPRRRRLVAIGLAAAAAVVVGGVALPQVLPQGEDASTGRAGSADGGARADRGADPGTAREGASGPPQAATGTPGLATPRVADATFRRDVLRARRLADLGVVATLDTESEYSGGAAERDSVRALARQCRPAGTGPGRLLVVRYAGQPALVVLRPPERGRQQAVLLRCGSDVPVRTVDLPAR